MGTPAARSGVGPGHCVDRDEAINQGRVMWALGGRDKSFIPRGQGATEVTNREYVCGVRYFRKSRTEGKTGAGRRLWPGFPKEKQWGLGREWTDSHV